ncbi:MAG: cardiolipin synthase [Acetobacteraceae bacterium]|nr:cardiolipin synthase [Acetobacteraceae bacterium]
MRRGANHLGVPAIPSFESWLLGRFADVRSDTITVIGLLLSAAVTVHVLLRKRDVSAAVGWMGLAWLSPVVGSALYFFLGVNRVQRRAERARRRAHRTGGSGSAPRVEIDANLRAMENATRRLTHRTAEHGNAFEVLHNGDAAYPRMVEAIAAAEHSVALSSYIFRADEAGGRFIDALVEAHRRGVAVRVLIDGIGAGYFYSGTYRRLRRAGVKVQRFMHSALPWRMPFLNLRTHKKILVVDGRIGFTGGMNIGRENVMALHPRRPVRDTTFRIEGPVVAQLVEAFALDWRFAAGEHLHGDRWYPTLSEVGPAVARVVTSGPDRDLDKIALALLQALACAERSVRLMTPYFLPDERIITGLALAAMRGVAVDVVIPRRSDHRYIDWATRAHVGPLIEAGVKIWRNPPPFAHTKLLVVDEAWSFVGSANWDTRSLRLNFELNMEVYDAELAQKLDGFIQERAQILLKRAELERIRLPWRLRDAAIRLCLPYL